MKKREDYPSGQLDRFIIRLPDGMRDRIKVLASQNERSMNAEIVFHLRKAIGWDAGNEQDRQGGHPDGLKQS
ncbi:Arc family DNA-binding protein [Paracoccus sp. MKU1]|uniref:Arc family DNA-binding protein n=1 Tax=Paracoccus sp. MKU1 TaxID=1745182 RepID=UPI0007194000|nr:Arc family DNA-binding protein [Paracoccus sp. MKU1]